LHGLAEDSAPWPGPALAGFLEARIGWDAPG
jgi:hypothetical protein